MSETPYKSDKTSDSKMPHHPLLLALWWDVRLVIVADGLSQLCAGERAKLAESAPSLARIFIQKLNHAFRDKETRQVLSTEAPDYGRFLENAVCHEDILKTTVHKALICDTTGQEFAVAGRKRLAAITKSPVLFGWIQNTHPDLAQKISSLAKPAKPSCGLDDIEMRQDFASLIGDIPPAPPPAPPAGFRPISPT